MDHAVQALQREVSDDHVIDLTVPAQAVAVDPAKTRAQTIAVVGMGYVGLPTAIAFAEAGDAVIGLDISADRLAAVARARVDLPADERYRLAQALALQTITLTGAGDDAALADVVIICVPTPVDEHLSPALGALRSACADVVARATPGQLILLTSTSYVGTTRDLLVGPLAERGLTVGTDVHVAFSPERIDPGSAVPQALVPRVVGGVTAACTERAAEALERITGQVHRVSSPEAAELTKLLENTYRAVNIAFVNEMASVAQGLGVDITEVIDAAATKPYGFQAFRPGPGVGGHCIPCDPHYLLWQLRADRVTLPVVESAMSAIAGRPRQVVQRAEQVLSSAGIAVHGARVHIVGVAYKPGVEDVRESPALEILTRLAAAGATVSFSDDLVESVGLNGGTVLVRTPAPAADEVDLVLVHTAAAGADLGWLADHALVLDTTYTIATPAHRVVL